MSPSFLGWLSFIWKAISEPLPANVELAGRVSDKYAEGSDGNVMGPGTSVYMDPEYYVTVSRTSFRVSGGIYHSVKVGDQVFVTVRGGGWHEGLE